MAVYTEVPDDDLAAFLATYDVGKAVSFKGIAEGVENSNFLLRTDTGTYILTLYEKRVAPADLPFFLGLMEHLAADGIPCPTPVRTRDGDALSELCGRPAAIITFLDGVWVRRPQLQHCRELGAALARMHLSGKTFDGHRPNTLTVTDWRGVVEPALGDAEAIAPGLAGEVTGEIAELESAWPDQLPSGVIHADLFPDNVFFLKNRLSGFIDFYFACNDALAYDIAICLNAWCFERDTAFNVTNARALLSAYESVRKLEPREYDALPLLARGAAMRFLSTRLYDWVNTPPGAFVKPKDPMEYVGKSRFHRDIRDASEYGLER